MSSADHIELPAPRLEGSVSVEECLARRRSVREFRARELEAVELSQLLWATLGVSSPDGDRTAPSAGGMLPLELHVAISSGLYHYEAERHRLRRTRPGDLRRAVFEAGLRQPPLLEAPAVFVLTAVFERTAARYGDERSPRYVHMEAGHAAQNLLLQAVALGLGAVVIGAFEDDELHRVLGLPKGQRPLYLVPVGAAAGK